MRREFYDAYRDLYEIYRVSQYELQEQRTLQRNQSLFDIRNLRVVDDAISEAISELGPGAVRRVRPDARFFLLINLHQMIALPIIHAQGSRIAELPVEAYIREDVRTILREASADSEEITGHAVVSALDRLWGKLRTTEMNIWG